MKRVMTYLPEGHAEGDRHPKIRDAANIADNERHVYDFKCPAPDCGAEFHLRRLARPLENTKEVSATFARNPSSRHADGMRLRLRKQGLPPSQCRL